MGSISIFTMLMTAPQVLAIWVGRDAAGVSILTWSAYLLSAMLWLWFGIRRGDLNIYLPCVGWIILDGAVIAGAAIDTWYRYPDAPGQHLTPSALPFEALDNVIMTPHIAGYTRDTMTRRVAVMAANVSAFVSGRPVLHRVTRA